MDSLVADYGTSSGSDQSDAEDSSDSSNPETSVPKKKPTESQTKKPALPPPSFDDTSGSVFINPYIEAENAKSAILEKHVKMIPAKEFITEINGKKICWMYRKGRCRFGSNCKYAHDSELYNQDQSQSSEDKHSPPTQSELSSKPPTKGSFPLYFPQSDLNQYRDEGKEKPVTSRKKRPGLSQSIVPGKKVMKMYYNSSK
ncbi:uncharacterized protein LOC103513192 [Diaphorina citri]|uniref:Uncharacterized protein LOC103513192 n=1 Tax=Diaphorina citri TaxID=121845 RepID=A0A1S3D7R6_DIACI|nr:uncharacterized protein LOC103513192 [Diaphorina citri]